MICGADQPTVADFGKVPIGVSGFCIFDGDLGGDWIDFVAQACTPLVEYSHIGFLRDKPSAIR